VTPRPRFTIVTPSLNQAAYVGQTIDSVVTQEGDFEIEYFVMDGGSTDGSIDVIRRRAGEVRSGAFPRRCASVSMHWLSEPDRGQADAINKGLRRGTGGILSYLNSDDRYQQGAFAKVAATFAAHPEADFVYGDGDVIDEEGNVRWAWLSRPYDHGVMTSYHYLWNDFTDYILQQATFWRRRVVDRIGDFDESFHFALDVEYWVRAGQVGMRLHHIREKLGQFRMMKGTKSLSSPLVFWPDYLEIFRRYRGHRTLPRFFAYYYYNVILQADLDIARGMELGRRVLDRWQGLPDEERQAMARQADRGFALACVLVADELRRRGGREAGSAAFRQGSALDWKVAMTPEGLSYLVKRAAGRRGGAFLDAVSRRLIAAYRLWRFDYRYATS
jgi:glycosyltransferase involved in cell wall biosynthesis